MDNTQNAKNTTEHNDSSISVLEESHRGKVPYEHPCIVSDISEADSGCDKNTVNIDDCGYCGKPIPPAKLKAVRCGCSRWYHYTCVEQHHRAMMQVVELPKRFLIWFEQQLPANRTFTCTRCDKQTRNEPLPVQMYLAGKMSKEIIYRYFQDTFIEELVDDIIYERRRKQKMDMSKSSRHSELSH